MHGLRRSPLFPPRMDGQTDPVIITIMKTLKGSCTHMKPPRQQCYWPWSFDASNTSWCHLRWRTNSASETVIILSSSSSLSSLRHQSTDASVIVFNVCKGKRARIVTKVHHFHTRTPTNRGNIKWNVSNTNSKPKGSGWWRHFRYGRDIEFYLGVTFQVHRSAVFARYTELCNFNKKPTNWWG